MARQQWRREEKGRRPQRGSPVVESLVSHTLRAHRIGRGSAGDDGSGPSAFVELAQRSGEGGEASGGARVADGEHDVVFYGGS